MIGLGMPRDQVVGVLLSLNAEDFSSGMQVGSLEGKGPGDLKEWMWSVPEYQVNLETRFKDDKLVAMNYWDATKPVTRYHHLMEHASISRITFEADPARYDVDVIEVFPER